MALGRNKFTLTDREFAIIERSIDLRIKHLVGEINKSGASYSNLKLTASSSQHEPYELEQETGHDLAHLKAHDELSQDPCSGHTLLAHL